MTVTFEIVHVIVLIIALVVFCLFCYYTGRLDGFDRGIEKGVEIGKDSKGYGA